MVIKEDQMNFLLLIYYRLTHIPEFEKPNHILVLKYFCLIYFKQCTFFLSRLGFFQIVLLLYDQFVLFAYNLFKDQIGSTIEPNFCKQSLSPPKKNSSSDSKSISEIRPFYIKIDNSSLYQIYVIN